MYSSVVGSAGDSERPGPRVLRIALRDDDGIGLEQGERFNLVRQNESINCSSLAIKYKGTYCKKKSKDQEKFG